MRGFKKRKPGVVRTRKLLDRNEVEFPNHALDRMKQRRITEFDVFSAIEHPDEVGLACAPGYARVRWHKTPRTSIDVVYDLRENRVLIISVMKNVIPKGEEQTGGTQRQKRVSKKRKPRQRKTRREEGEIDESQ